MLYTAITREEESSQRATGKVVITRKICTHCPLLLYKKDMQLYLGQHVLLGRHLSHCNETFFTAKAGNAQLIQQYKVKELCLGQCF
jgi:hypothetical protein